VLYDVVVFNQNLAAMMSDKDSYMG